MNRNLNDDSGLRMRFPEINAMSFDGEISYLIARPENVKTMDIEDEGAMM